MLGQTTSRDSVKSWPGFIKRSYASPWSGRQLVIIASVLHVFLAICLFIVGRAEISPTLVDRNGIMASFAFDSYVYRDGAISLAEFLQKGRIMDWATAAQPIHVKFLAIPSALLGPILGFNTLSAEPYNLLCYAAVVGLVFAIGREVRGRRTGLLAAAAVAVWPTFLLHSMQLLKDPLFVAASLVFLLCVISSLTRVYRPMMAGGIAALTMLILLLLFVVRSNAIVVIFAAGLLGFALLLLRQWLQRRLLIWNMMPTIAVLLTTLILISVYSRPPGEKIKHFPSDQSGQPKIATNTTRQLPSLMVKSPTAEDPRTRNGLAPGWSDATNRMVRRISAMRSRFAAAYPEAGSTLDGNQEFRNLNDLLAYVPRAVEIGLWAPFPHTWISAGRRVGSVGRLLATAETVLIYLCQLLAVIALVREPRQLALWFLIIISLLGVTALALIVPNVGALYRFRYTFWVPAIIVAMVTLENLGPFFDTRSYALRRGFRSRRPADDPPRTGNLNKPMKTLGRYAATSLFLCLLATVTACSSLSQSNRQQSFGFEDRSASAAVESHLGFSLLNLTGTTLHGLYISPTTSSGWEENVLGGLQLGDGDTVMIRFNPNEKATTWDMRIEAADGHYTEMKNVKVGGFSEMTLMLKPVPGAVVVAEVE